MALSRSLLSFLSSKLKVAKEADLEIDDFAPRLPFPAGGICKKFFQDWRRRGMDFDLNEPQKLVKEAIRRFAETEIAPLVEEAEEDEKFPVALFPKMGALGYLCIRYPPKYGGAGVDKVAEVVFREEMSRVCQGIASGWSAHSHLATFPIYSFGTEEQKREYLVPAIKGERIGAFSLTEPNAGSDAKAIETTARKEGDTYIINGSKTFASNATFADYVVVAAYTDKSQGYKGISLFIVDRGTPGFEVVRKIKKEGVRCCETAELAFVDCRVPERNLLGGKEGCFPLIMATLSEGRIGIAGNMVGIAQAAYELASSYSQQRTQFGRPISKFQAIGFKIADMATEINAARLLAYQAAWMHDQGRKCVKEAHMAKLFASEVAVRAARETMQILGGIGQTRETPAGRYLRDALAYTVGEGTSEIQRLVITREIGL